MNALWGTLVMLACLFVPASAHAHVKWFFPYDLTKPPLPVGDVITNHSFVWLFILSVFAIYAFFWIERLLYRKRVLADRLERLSISAEQSFWILRIATGIFFLSLFAFGLAGQGFFITPELKTDAAYVPWLQLAMALLVLYRPALPLVGVGILVLYGIAVVDFGLFHMLDYLIFLGIGAYFLLSWPTGETWRVARYVTLFACTGLTLLWASVEKWGYPHWTYPLLRGDETLLMGLSPEFYMVLAGFVEFNLTFILLGSASMISRVIALGLESVFVLAIFKFGLVDAVGHLMIIAILSVLVFRGPTKAREFLVLPGKSLWTEAYFMTGLYVLAFNFVFIAYYGLYAVTR